MERQIHLCQMKVKKEPRIQILRGIAIIAVVLIHTCPPGFCQVICRPFLNFSVALFLFLSGYLTNCDHEDWYILIKKRIFRVLIPYFIWTIIYTLPSISISKVLINLLTAKGAMTLYYLVVYIQLVLLTPFLAKYAKTTTSWLGFTIIPVCAFMMKQYFPITPSNYSIWAWFWKTSFVLWFPYYLMGLYLGYKQKTLHIGRRIVLGVVFLLIISILIQIIDGYHMMECGLRNPGTQLKLSAYFTSSLCILLAFIYLRSDKNIDKLGIIRNVGDYSFGIYLCHILVIRILIKYGWYNHLPYVINTFVVFIVSYLLVVLLSKLVNNRTSMYLGIK